MAIYKLIDMNSIAIIPARGGSKRILRKNIKLFLDRPIIKYSIDAALEAKCFTEIMVSTDDEEIASLAKRYGANVPLLRSETTSSDKASTTDVIEDVISSYKKKRKIFKYGCLIYPTAPFVNSKILKDGYRKLIESKADSVVPVVRFSYPPQRGLIIKNNRLKMIYPKNYDVRSQELSPIYHDAGQFYWFKVNSVLKQKKLFAKRTVPIIISELESQDIDNEEDWHLAELKYKLLYRL
jgi:N-acylneuraminate cytidylyltransferase